MNIVELVDEVFVTNLERRSDRLERITDELERHAIPFTRWIAEDDLGTDKSAMWWNAYNFKEQVAHAKRKGLKSFLHLDDDVYFIEDFHNRFAEAWADVPDDWQMVSLGNVFGRHVPVTWKVTRSEVSWGNHAVIIRANMYDLLLETITGENWSDVEVATLMSSVNFYVMHPSLAFQHRGYSDLKGGDVPNDIF